MALPRRTFLRGLGATLSLPLLDAMVPALSAVGAAAAAPVRRLGFVYIPMGSNPALWTPAEIGRLTTLSPSLASLAPYLEHLTVFTNLELKNANTTGNHASSNCGASSAARAPSAPRAATTRTARPSIRLRRQRSAARRRFRRSSSAWI